MIASQGSQIARVVEGLVQARESGLTRRQMVQTLAEMGIDEGEAHALADVVRGILWKRRLFGGVGLAVCGALLLALGLGVTFALYALAASGWFGGYYVAMTGLMLVGSFLVFKGILRIVTSPFTQ